MRVLSFRGTPKEMGRAFGESCREQVAELYARRVQNAIAQALKYGGRGVSEREVLGAAAQSLGPTRAYDPRAFEELEGIAQGSNMTVTQILAMNGLTDLRDVLSWYGDLESLGGCSSFVIQRDGTAGGEVLCGQTWDLATDNLPFVLGVHRAPDQGPETWCLTTVGCLSLIGLNGEGIAVGTTNIRTTDARPGVTYLSLIHKALGASSLEEAARAITEAERAGAHYYYICDAHGRAVALECSARSFTRVDVGRGAYVHTNHCLIEENVAIQGHNPLANSVYRQERLLDLASSGGVGVEQAMGFLGDREGGALAILRDDVDGINTNGAVVMAPERGMIWACQGHPREGAWVDLKGAR